MAKATINWEDINAAGSATAYRVYVSTSQINIDTPPAPIAEVGHDTYSYEVTGLVYGQTYYVRISSVLDNMEEFSEEMTLNVGNNVMISRQSTFHKYYERQTFSKPGYDRDVIGTVVGLEVDHLGHCYVLTSSGYLYKFDPYGNRLWMTNLGGRSYGGLAIDLQGNVYAGANDTLIKVDATGNRVWNVTPSYFMGVRLRSIAIDPQGVIITLGSTNSNTYGYVTRFDVDGKEINYGPALPSSIAAERSRVFTDPEGNIHVTGYITGSDRLYYTKLDPFLNQVFSVNKNVRYDVYTSILDYTGNRIFFFSNSQTPEVFDLDGNDLEGTIPAMSQGYAAELDEDRNLYAVYSNRLSIFDKDLNQVYTGTVGFSAHLGSQMAVDPGSLAVQLKLVSS